MDEAARVVLVGADLLMRSRISSAVPGVRIEAARASDQPHQADVVFVDLNSDVPERLAAVATWRAAAPEARIVGFCGHDERETRRQAMAAGADRVVTNGGLATEAARSLARPGDV